MTLSVRYVLYPDQTAKEAEWFSTPYSHPSFISDGDEDNLHVETFKNLIWNHHPMIILPEYGATPNELAHLCGDGPDGWITSALVRWVLDRLNRISDSSKTMCFTFDTIGPGLLSYLRRCKEKGKLADICCLTFVLNVDKNVDGSVFISSNQKPGSHWSLAVFDLKTNVVTYCDLLGWSRPQALLQSFEPVFQMFGKEKTMWTMAVAHYPSSFDHVHRCSEKCLKYPVQQCSDVWGVLILYYIALSVLDENSFKHLLTLNAHYPCFLEQPTLYRHFLRRKLIRWFVTGVIDVSFVTQAINTNTDTMISMPSSPSAAQKRKIADESQVDKHTSLCISSSLPSKERKIASISCLEHHISDISMTDTWNNGSANLEPQDTGCINHKPQDADAINKKKYNNMDAINNNQNNTDLSNKSQSPRIASNKQYNNVTLIALLNKGTANKLQETDTANNSRQCESNSSSKQQSAEPADNQSTTKCSAGNKPQDMGSANCEQDADINTQIKQDADMASMNQQEIDANNDTRQNSGASISSPQTGVSKQAKKRVHCPYCRGTFASRSGLVRHSRTMHPEKERPNPKKGNHHCVLCKNSYTHFTVKDITMHYQSVHDKEIHIEKKEFPDEEQFKKWKEEIQMKSLTVFSKIRGTRVIGQHRTLYYRCHRSGTSKIRSDIERNRALKIHGTCKISSVCTAYMKAQIEVNGGKTKVEYCLQHIGHDQDLHHLRLSKGLRSEVEARLRKGFQIREVLQSIDDIKQTDRDALLTSNDVCNIRRKYVSETRPGKDDDTTVSRMAPELGEGMDGQTDFPNLQSSDGKLPGLWIQEQGQKMNDTAICSKMHSSDDRNTDLWGQEVGKEMDDAARRSKIQSKKEQICTECSICTQMSVESVDDLTCTVTCKHTQGVHVKSNIKMSENNGNRHESERENKTDKAGHSNPASVHESNEMHACEDMQQLKDALRAGLNELTDIINTTENMDFLQQVKMYIDSSITIYRKEHSEKERQVM